MGNFSRTTFDVTRNYVGVRLQQGVPVLDADWNEMDDAIRNEIYSGFVQLFPDGVQPGGQDLLIIGGSSPTNNFLMTAGAALVGGRPLRVSATVNYTAQPWFNNPTRAAQDGVAVIPPLTTPAVSRQDLVYLDVWEREVRSTEDGNLINPFIGVETCVRVKREFAVRVSEGNQNQTLPAVPPGHSFVPLAVLNRQAGQANVVASPPDDLRPKLFSTRGPRSLSFVPAFLPFGTAANPWSFDAATSTARCSTFLGSGLLPLLLPDGATLLSLRVQGNSGEVYIVLYRHQTPTTSVLDQLINSAFIVPGGTPTDFDSVFAVPATYRFNIVDNTRYSYFMLAQCGQKPTMINRITVNFQY